MATHPAWHPWFGEIAIVLRRRALGWSAAAALIALTLFGLGLGWARAEGISLALAGHRALAALAKWPVPATLMIAAVAHLLLHARLQAISTQLRNGWWAAMPIKPRSRGAALSAVAGTVVAICLIVLMAVAGMLGAHGAAGTALVVVAAGVSVGAATALSVALRPPRARRRNTSRVGIRRPLFATVWLDDRRLPHLSDWQRREALWRWRTHASAAPVLAALVLVPAGASPLTLMGLLLFALSAGWLGLVLRASIEVAATAGALLYSTPASALQQARAALRYPAFACTCASFGGLLTAFAAGSWPLLVGWLALVALLLVPAAPAAWRLIVNLRKQCQ